MIHRPLSNPLDSIHKEILNHLRRMQERLGGQGDAGQQPDLPSVTEVLTIQQFGFPRSYNLNDGMGPDLVTAGHPLDGHSKSVQSPERN
ncbi:MAG: hypothetical protein P4L36_14975 [Holophaga sp.]|nr:hypothetical protein [Holophaga sp.]